MKMTFMPCTPDPDVITRNEQMLYGGSRLGMETTAIQVNQTVDYINDCNNDGLASGIVQLGAFTPTTGVVVEIILDGFTIADITWNTANSIASHGVSLVNEINAQAEGYYAEMIDMSGYVYIRLKEIITGSLESQVLTVELDNVDSPSYVKREITIGECHENRILGKKFYELSNYLGNVMEVISDRKVSLDINTDGATDYFEADVVSFSDYYPFGMEMPGRKGTASYRYSYNGMEQDPEVSGEGNSYDYGARLYNPRIGRWFKRDSKEGKYPFASPYSYAFNKPLFLKDYDGRDVIVVITSTDKAPEAGVNEGQGQVGHITMLVTNYTKVTLIVLNTTTGETMPQDFWVETGTSTLIENATWGNNTESPALHVNPNQTEDYLNDKVVYYRLDTDDEFISHSPDGDGTNQGQWIIDPNLNGEDFDEDQKYYTYGEVKAELDIFAEVEVLKTVGEPYKHTELDPTTGNVDQNDCGSLVVHLLDVAGLADESLGLRQYSEDDFVITVYTPTHIEEDLAVKYPDAREVPKGQEEEANKLDPAGASAMVQVRMAKYIASLAKPKNLGKGLTGSKGKSASRPSID